MSTIEQFNKYVMPSYGRYDLVLDKGEGRQAVDENGKKYIDFGSGIGTNSLGYCNEDWVKAVCDQAHRIQHTSNYYYTKVQADFAKALCETAGYTDMFFGNSGAEANECAIKIARKYSFDKYGKGRHNIITLVNSFHGRTLCTLSATGQDVFHNYFFPFVEGFINVEANNIKDLRAKLDDTVCAVMFEYVQGEGGVMALQQDFVDEIFRLCAEKDVLTIADEVQTGVGRTGKFLAGDNFGKKADLTTLAKGTCRRRSDRRVPFRREVRESPHARNPRLHIRRQPHFLRRRTGGAQHRQQARIPGRGRKERRLLPQEAADFPGGRFRFRNRHDDRY